jgi:hypothetical protein
MRAFAVALSGVLGLGACGTDEVDLSGVYRVDTEVGSSPCGADMPIPLRPPFLKFTKGEIFGTPYFSMETCVDEAATSCTGGGLFGDSFAEPIDGGWLGVLSAASGTTSCTLAYTEMTAKLSGAMLVVETYEHSEEITASGNCTAEEAERRGKAMPCSRHERIDATKL